VEEGKADGGYTASENFKDLIGKKGLSCFLYSRW